MWRKWNLKSDMKINESFGGKNYIWIEMNHEKKSREKMNVFKKTENKQIMWNKLCKKSIKNPEFNKMPCEIKKIICKKWKMNRVKKNHIDA